MEWWQGSSNREATHHTVGRSVARFTHLVERVLGEVLLHEELGEAASEAHVQLLEAVLEQVVHAGDGQQEESEVADVRQELGTVPRNDTALDHRVDVNHPHVAVRAHNL